MSAKCCENRELTAAYAKLARFLRVIGDDNRLKILCLLKDKERCVCELWQELGLKQNLVSSHLKVLADQRLLHVRSEGRRKYYSINTVALAGYNKLLLNFLKNYERKDN